VRPWYRSATDHEGALGEWYSSRLSPGNLIRGHALPVGVVAGDPPVPSARDTPRSDICAMGVVRDDRDARAEVAVDAFENLEHEPAVAASSAPVGSSQSNPVPRTRACRTSARRVPPRMFGNVDLPLPDGPSKNTNSRLRRSKSTPRSAYTSTSPRQTGKTSSRAKCTWRARICRSTKGKGMRPEITQRVRSAAILASWPRLETEAPPGAKAGVLARTAAPTAVMTGVRVLRPNAS
jgi:hypothetical protein